ncbi:hypothetical protein [Paludibaculum fermentans]|uniref:hypothetical protein n=1 Tax=Paludibaculum fermentans TaxID=1473598 RepID=UPI003EB76E6E
MEPNTTLAPQGAEGAAPACPTLASAVLNGQIVTVQAPAPLAPHAYLRPLNQIAAPGQCPPGVILTTTSSINLQLQSPSPFGFHFHWLREAVRGVLQGTTGLCLDATGDALLAATLSGTYTATLTRDDHGTEPWLRLTLAQAAESTLQCSAKASITANIDTVLPATSDELLKAILGIHSLQWLRGTLAQIGSVRWKRIAEECGAAGSALEALFEAFQQFGARAESVLWKAAAEPASLSELLSWSYSITNDCPNLAAFRDRLHQYLDRDPAFASSIAAQWIESVAGCNLVQITNDDTWDRLHKAAALLDRLTNTDKLMRDAPAILALLRRLPVMAAQELDPLTPDSWALPRLQQLLGVGLSPQTLLDRAVDWLPLRNRIYQAAKEALQKQLPAELSLLLESSTGGTALVDASFSMTTSGLEQLHRVLNGDLAALYGTAAPGVQLRHGLLTHHVRRTRHIELHLPFLDARSWRSGVSALATGEVLCDAAGRLITWYSTARDFHQLSNELHSNMVFATAFSSRDSGPINDNFNLTFEDTRKVSAAGHHEAWFRVLQAYGISRPELPNEPTQATLTLTLPGRFAGFWATAPHSRDEQYIPTMCRISRAMQSAVRYWLPTLYFADLQRFRTPAAAFPLLAYQYSAPYTDVKAHRLSYDFMSSEMLIKALNSAIPGLRQALPELQNALAAAGMQDLASTYNPKNVARIIAQVQVQRHNFNALLAADTYFIEEMVRLADMTCELRALYTYKPAVAIHNLTRYSGDLVKALHSHLRRLYAGSDFVALGSLLLIAATSALAGGSKGPIPISATLKLEHPEGIRVYTNEAVLVRSGEGITTPAPK